MLGQEDFQRVQFLRDTLDVIQPIHTNNQLDTIKAFLEFGYPSLYCRLLDVLSKNP